jgi:hypothetical protein
LLPMGSSPARSRDWPSRLLRSPCRNSLVRPMAVC